MTKTLMIVVLIVAAGCGGDDSFTSTPETTPEEQKPSCEANVTGRITLVNAARSVQTAMINGVDYGKINTGASIDVDLPPGQYSVQLNWLDGSAACMPAFINIAVCSTQTLTCMG